MKIIWLGHSGFRIEIADQVLLIDPWLTGNPSFDESRRAEAITGATHMLLSHGHSDHADNAAAIAREVNIPVAGIADLMALLEKKENLTVTGFNKGGTITIGELSVTMVNAAHSSSYGGGACGSEAGFMITGEGRTLYFSGDTDVMSDMEIFQDLHHPEIGILCTGGHYTMDMKRAAYAARRFFDFTTVIPCHYRTYPILEQSADALKAGLPGVDVIEPEIRRTH